MVPLSGATTYTVTVSLAVPDTFEQVTVYVWVPVGMLAKARFPLRAMLPVQALSELEAEQVVAYWLTQLRV
jgi:hypothetical protein